jgi:hypothetical protein
VHGKQSEQLYRTAGAIGLLVGIGALLLPERLIRLYGVSEELGGPGVFGWRLFGIRNISIGSQALAGNQAARDTVLAVQPPDILMFWHSYRAGLIPLPAAIAATCTASAVLAISCIARARSRS